MRFIVVGGGCYGIYHSGQLYKAIKKGKLPPETQLIIIDRNAEPKAKQHYGELPEFSYVQTDWQAFLQKFLFDPSQFDPQHDSETTHIVPAPFAPHLMFDWLQFATQNRLRELGLTNILVEREGFDYKLNLPYEYTDPKNGNHFMSRAGWTCPTACIEPRLCPAVKNVRDWDLDHDLRDFIAGQPVKSSVSAAERLQAASMANGQTAGAVLEAVAARPVVGFYSGVETFTCHHYMHGIGTVPAGRMFEACSRVVNLARQLSDEQPEARIAVGTVSHCHGVVATLALKKV